MSSITRDVTGLHKKLQSLIDEVMDNFDFNKVRKVMKQLNWRWASAEDGIPEVYELKDSARRLLNECLFSMIQHGEETWNIGTGGFYVHATNYRDSDEGEDGFRITLKLSFELTSWDAY